MKRSRGFSLVELMVVMAVLGILAAAAMPLTEAVRARERERELKHALWEIRTALDAHKRAFDEGRIVKSGPPSGYPASLTQLVEGVPSAGGSHDRIYFLRRLPRDPFSDDNLPAADSWGLRSYESPPDWPQPGIDVYDVYSRSSHVALDGTPVKRW